MDTRRLGSWTGIIGLVLLIGLPALFFLVILVRFAAAPWTASALVFDYVVGRVTDASGWNMYLVKGAVVLALIPFAFAVREMVRLRGSNSTRRVGAQVLFAAYLATFYLVMAAASDGNRWTVSGEVTKWYSVTPEGIREFDASSVTSSDPRDPKYGVPLRPITPEIAASIERARLGIRPEAIAATDVADVRFFDGATGQPLVWYFERADGRHDLFSSAGFHPQFNEPLLPVTRSVVEAIQKRMAEGQQRANAEAVAERGRRASQAVEQRRRRYLGAGQPHGTWVVATRDGRVDRALAAKVASEMASASVLSDAFVHDGLSERVAAGDTAFLNETGLRGIQQIVVVRASVASKPASVAGENLFPSDAFLSVTVLGQDGSTRLLEAKARGTGFSETSAQAMAMERALADLREKIRR